MKRVMLALALAAPGALSRQVPRVWSATLRAAPPAVSRAGGGRSVAEIPRFSLNLSGNAGVAAARPAFPWSVVDPTHPESLRLTDVPLSRLFLELPSVETMGPVGGAGIATKVIEVPHRGAGKALNRLDEAAVQSAGIQKILSGEGGSAGAEGRLKAGADAAFDSAGPGLPAGVEAPQDLPPAGLTELTPERLEWLHANLVAGGAEREYALGAAREELHLARGAKVWSEDAFRMVVEGRPNYRPVLLHDLRSYGYGREFLTEILFGMYKSIEFITQGDLPAPERAGIAVALSRRYAELLDAVQNDPTMPENIKTRVRRSLSLLHEDVLVEELLRMRQTARELGGLEKAVRALVAPGKSADAPVDDGGWTIPRPISKAQEIGTAQSERVAVSLRDIFWRIKNYQFELQSRASRYRRALREGGFSARTVRRFEGELKESLALLLGWVPKYYAETHLVGMLTLPKAFYVSPKAHHIFQIPNNKNLRLVAEPGRFLVAARFETNIRNEAVLNAVKASIEDYWQGAFSLGDKTYRLRTEVIFHVLTPDEPFSEGSLQLMDGGNVPSRVNEGRRLFLGRTWTYRVPAHEFGHILGLNDEYRAIYNPVGRETLYIKPANLMGSNGGILQRHLKTAYLLLRRRSLAPSGKMPAAPNSSGQ